MEEQIKPYVNGNISASYDGPTAPRPYEGNPFEKMLKNMKNLPPDVTVKIGESGTPSLYKISTNTELSAMDIDATFDGLIDANTKAQLMDDAWYNFDYALGKKIDTQTGKEVSVFDKEMGQQIYNNDQIAQSRSYQTHIDAIDIELKSITDKNIITQKLKDKADYIAAKEFSEGEIVKGNNEFGKMWDKDPASAKYSLYVGKMRGDVIKAAGYNKEKIDFKTNQEWVANKKMEQTAFEKGYQLNTDGTWSKLPWADDGTKTTRGADGKLRNAKGEEVPESIFTGLTNMDNSYNDKTDNEKLKISEKVVNTQIQEYQNDNNNRWKVIFQNIAQENGLEGTLGYKMNVNTTVNGVAQTFSSDLIGNLAGKDGILEINDINYISNSINKFAGDNPNAKTFNVEYGGGKFKITSDQLKILNTLKTGMENYAQGNIAEIPNELKGMAKEWVEFAGAHRINEINIDNRRKYINNVTESAFNEVGKNLTSKQKERYKEYLNNPDLQGTLTKKWNSIDKVYEPVFTPNPEWTDLNKIVDVSKINKYKKDAYESAGQTFNYYSAILTNNKPLQDNLIAFIIQEGKTGERLNPKPTGVRQTDDGKGWLIQYAYGKEGKEPTNTTKEITNAQAAQIGIPLFEHPELEEAFRYGDTELTNLLTKTKIYTAPTVDNPKGTEAIMPISYKIVKKGRGNYEPVITYQGNNYFIKTEQPLASANAAYKAMSIIAEQRYTSMQDLLDRITLQNQGF
jgi:hypothetical protein